MHLQLLDVSNKWGAVHTKSWLLLFYLGSLQTRISAHFSFQIKKLTLLEKRGLTDTISGKK